jgi:hypothetical protein
MGMSDEEVHKILGPGKIVPKHAGGGETWSAGRLMFHVDFDNKQCVKRTETLEAP